jgi:two-component sensor histidine kinase
MSKDGPSKPIIEPPPGGDDRGETDHHALRLRIHQQEILSQLGVIALKGTPLAELLKDTVQLCANGLLAEFCKVLEYVPTQNRLLMRAGVGWDEGLVGTASIGADLASPSGYALRTGKPVISNHLESEERFRTPELLTAHGVRRAINVILQGDSEPYGVLEVDSRSPGEFSEHDIAFLQGAANILGMAIERQRQEEVLKVALEHQQVLLKEINHRVKNSLQLVAAMLRVQAGDDPQLGRRLQEASSRILAIGRAHDRLYRTPQVESIEVAEYLSDVCADLRQITPNCEISFVASVRLFLSTDKAIGSALIVSELVANAAKHAYPNKTGTVWVHLELATDDVARISVRDEGPGLPSNFEVGERTGFGMRLVRALAQQVSGQIRIERKTPGTEFVLEIPVGAGPTAPQPS